MFRNVGTQNSDSGRSLKIKNTTFRTRRNIDIKKVTVVFFLLGDSPASEFLCADVSEQTKCFETSAHKIQTPGDHSK
jgi:hypothetical protein